jgi:hypothetical protein
MPAASVTRRQILKGAGAMGAAGLAVLAPSGILARAEEGENENSLVGAWKGTATVTGFGSFGTLLSFASGGVVVHSTALDLQNSTNNNNLATPSYGAWKRTGEGKYSVKFAFFTFDQHTDPSGSGEVKEQLTVNGNDLTGTISVMVFDTNGNPLGGATPGTLTAKRIQAD